MCDKQICACRTKAAAAAAAAVVRPKIEVEKLRKLEEAYSKFAEIDSKSMLKKHLTTELFQRLKTRTTTNGSTLMDVIQSGLINPDSNVGIYAPDQEAYTVFAELFDLVIEQYHGNFTAKAIHPNLNWGKPEELGNLDPEGKYVISTRIRCARSIEGYPLNPTMNECHYRDLEEKVYEALMSLTDELKGTYYTLGALDKETRQQLIDEHFLFKEGDRFLEAANANRHWPVDKEFVVAMRSISAWWPSSPGTIGRGIFFNEGKTFLVWCNEEDHMRLISMEKGGNLASVYERLVKAVCKIGEKLEFSRHRRLGFLTFCPTNLGTTIRASVHVRLPKLSADYPRFEEIAGMYNLQIRGTRGEHTESEEGIYDISNKRRLGLTEAEAIFEMRNGVLALLDDEKRLEGL